jgi:DNA-binding XRE family transcriptional regulator
MSLDAPMSTAELRAARAELGLTGGEFAKAFGVTERTVRRWEGGIYNFGPKKGEASPIPLAVAILTRAALAIPSIRIALGVTRRKKLKTPYGKTANAKKSSAKTRRPPGDKLVQA